MQSSDYVRQSFENSSTIVMNDKLESLSKRRLELRKETGSEHFAWQNSGPSQIFKLIVSVSEKILKSVNVVV